MTDKPRYHVRKRTGGTTNYHVWEVIDTKRNAEGDVVAVHFAEEDARVACAKCNALDAQLTLF